MSTDSFWDKRVRTELRQAEAARQAGNEGKARVCARRAAGVVAEEYLRRQGIATRSQNAYDLLQTLQIHPALSEQARAVTGHFTVRVDPTHNLPVEADLIAETLWLAQELLGEGL